MVLKPNPQEMISRIYKILYETYQPQGWWPLIELQDKKSKPDIIPGGYHPADYSFPCNKSQQYEICLGAILTQNTSWNQVAKILKNLYVNNLLDCSTIKNMRDTELGTLIKPSGYYNQKAKKIKFFSGFFSALNGKNPERNSLLKIWGIGPETADSILLYAFKEAVFVIDAYTVRIFSRILNKRIKNYHELQSFFHSSFRDVGIKEKVNIFNEYHSLLVCFAKKVCKKNPCCERCRLKELCGFELENKKIRGKNEKKFN